MKIRKHTFLSLILVLSMLMGLAATASAAGSVTYTGQAEKFIFAPGSDHSLTDLFENFKNVMPGDHLTETITVKNDASNKVKVKIYVRSLGAQEGSEDFLSKLHLTVATSTENEMAYMFDASADQTDGMTDWVLLGTLYSGGVVNLDVTLDVPIELGNDYQDAIGYLNWEFKIEEFPIDPDDPTPPTGDSSKVALFGAVAVVSAAALFVLVLMFKHRQSEQN